MSMGTNIDWVMVALALVIVGTVIASLRAGLRCWRLGLRPLAMLTFFVSALGVTGVIIAVQVIARKLSSD